MSPKRAQPKRGGKRTFAVPGDASDPTSFAGIVPEWLEWLASHNYSRATMVGHSFYVSRFASWAELRGVHRPADVTLPVLEAYQRHLSLQRKSDGSPLSWSARARPLVALRSFFSWCTRSRRTLHNPASGLVMPRQGRKLPSATLSHTEALAVLSVPDTGTVTGLRDRAAMELLYATAMRRGELVGLELPDIDLARGWLTLRETKTRWDRVVPMGERASAWLTRYLAGSRPHLVRDDAVTAVFLATNGERLGANWLTGQVHRYMEASGVGKPGSCHLFRHSAATLMLEGGADVRYVQELLGHRSLASTHIYTRVAPEHLAAVHRATHPGAVLPGHEASS